MASTGLGWLPLASRSSLWQAVASTGQIRALLAVLSKSTDNGLRLVGRQPRCPSSNACWSEIGFTPLEVRAEYLAAFMVGGGRRLFCSFLRGFYRRGRSERGGMPRGIKE